MQKVNRRFPANYGSATMSEIADSFNTSEGTNASLHGAVISVALDTAYPQASRSKPRLTNVRLQKCQYAYISIGRCQYKKVA